MFSPHTGIKLQRCCQRCIKVCDHLISMLSTLYAFYHASPLNRSNLKKSFASLAVKDVMPLCVGGTRWLAHTATALRNFWDGYTALFLHLGQVFQHVTSINYYISVDNITVLPLITVHHSIAQWDRKLGI